MRRPLFFYKQLSLSISFAAKRRQGIREEMPRLEANEQMAGGPGQYSTKRTRRLESGETPDIVVGETQCTACLTGCMPYDNMFGLGCFVKKHRRLVKYDIKRGWTQLGVCRIVKRAEPSAPIEASSIESTLDSAAESIAQPSAVPAERDWHDTARPGDTVMVHHGPCSHWLLNALICPCWFTGPVKILYETFVPVEASLGTA